MGLISNFRLDLFLELSHFLVSNNHLLMSVAGQLQWMKFREKAILNFNLGLSWIEPNKGLKKKWLKFIG